MEYEIDYIEIYTPMAKLLAYWHQQALGFEIEGEYIPSSPEDSKTSFVLRSQGVRLVLTSTFPVLENRSDENEIEAFINKNQCGVKRIVLGTNEVRTSYETAISNGGISTFEPRSQGNEMGTIVEAGIKLYEENEINFIDRSNYTGYFRPGYVKTTKSDVAAQGLFTAFDHIAAELDIDKCTFWTNYLSKTIGTNLVQAIDKNHENKTGMVLKINQSINKKMTFVMAEPDGTSTDSKISKNIRKFGQGVHHLAFQTEDILKTIEVLGNNKVDFVSFPPAYYTLLRENPEMKNIDIDSLEKHGILIDKEDDTLLYQKFIKPYGDRPFFFYEIVQRVNGYNGFALKNINVLKKAEEYQIMSDKK
jgi:4-hydroxyphenylpyruvate dioxygenase